MRVMVLTEASLAQREYQLLTRLEIGLADDGASVLHAVPYSCAADAASAFSSTLVRYDEGSTPFGRGARARQVLKSAAEQLDEPELRLDLVHVFGARAWGLGSEVAAQCGARLVLEVWKAELIDEALRLARAAARVRPEGVVGLATASEKIGEELAAAARAGIGARVEVTPWGVAHAETSRPPIDRERGVALSVFGSGRDLGEVRRMLEGVQRAAKRVENLLVFLDSAAADRAPVWRAARRLGLLGRVTAVGEMEARREPILQTDILALPEPLGECRTLPLAAMAEGVAVIARPDAYHASWLNTRTARLVGGADQLPEAQEWERALVAAVENAEETASLTNAARAYVRQHRSVAGYVDAVKRLYGRVLKVEAVAGTVG